MGWVIHLEKWPALCSLIKEMQSPALDDFPSQTHGLKSLWTTSKKKNAKT